MYDSSCKRPSGGYYYPVMAVMDGLFRFFQNFIYIYVCVLLQCGHDIDGHVFFFSTHFIVTFLLQNTVNKT